VAETRSRFTLILLTDPGAPARQVHLPRAFPLLAGLFSILSLTGSLLAGREARAWFEPELEVPGLVAESVPFEPELFDEPQTLQPTRITPRVLGLAAEIVPTAQAPSPAELGAVSAPASRQRPELALPSFLPRGPAQGGKPLISGKLLRLYDVNGARSLRVTPFNEDGLPDPDAFAKLRTFMRCRRSGHQLDMDPRLIAVLSRISQHFGDAVIEIISGHRKPDGKVTSETSQHAFGTAADIRIAGVSLEALKDAAKGLGARGIGVYTKSRFVHVDVRQKPYYWRDDNGDEAGAAAGALAAIVP
jgi:uncharacterized protein YcbK (DUF882 family)